MEVAAVRLRNQCFSPGNAPFSIFIPTKRGSATLEIRDRKTRANRLEVCLSSAVLRLEDPVDSACRPFLQIDIESGEDEDGEEDCEDDRKERILEVAETFANGNPGSTLSGLGYHNSGGNEAACQCRTSNGAISSNSNSEASSKLDERERLRRERIGLANKGKTPWNKGKCHSPETIARMKVQCKAVMQDPQMREKLRQYSHPQSEETKEKIRNFMKNRMDFERRQLTIVQEWKDFIANMARRGMVGDDELQWDSYKVFKRDLRRQYYATKKEKQKKRGPKVLQYEHRLRISESIKAKWADSDYRNRVVKRIRDTKPKRPKVSKGKLIDPEFDVILDSFIASSNGSSSEPLSSSNAKVGSYNDPLSKEKLKKIKLLRFQNTAKKEAQFEPEKIGSDLGDLKGEMRTDLLQEKKNETNVEAQAAKLNGLSAPCVDITLSQQTQEEVAERARVLLAEAEQAAIFAAQALDAAGGCDERLSDSLLETWTLLDEASKFISRSNVNRLVDKLI